jgi:multisubunit Na+/H+ antiporter MnhB subunit
LTVVLLVLVFYRIPPQPRAQISPWLHLRNLVIAGAVGLWGFAMVLLGVEQSLFTSISDYFSLNAVPAAHGGNIVNVILVDFRGFDTMGEITVLSLAAIGGYALLRASRLRLARPAINAPANDEENNSLLTDTVEGGNRD